MQERFRFDFKKAIEIILYVAQKCPDTYKMLKILYFADIRHLEKYGRFIWGDRYIAMKSGPVPSGMYDMIKVARGDSFLLDDEQINETIGIKDQFEIIPLRPPDLDYFSESDIECIDWSIQSFGSLKGGVLKRLSHDKAYKSANRNEEISLESIVDQIGNPDLTQHLFEPNYEPSR